MKKRYKMNGRKSRKLFTKTADRTHKFNFSNRAIMRGGNRM